MAPKRKEPQDSSEEASDEDDDMIEDQPKTLDYAQVLSRKGYTALQQKDFLKAAECYSRALEIRVAHFGDLSQECFSAYFFYGSALLRNALVDLCSDIEDGITQAESPLNSVSTSNVENDESSDSEDSASDLEEEENDESEIDTDDTPDNDEDESELDLAWKILDIARVIIERQPTQSLDTVHVLCALGDANFYRDDLCTCLVDYMKASHILDSLFHPKLMYRAKLYHRIGLCWELGGKTEEANVYYRKAVACCCSNLSALRRELRSLSSSSTLNVYKSGKEAVDTNTVPHQSDHSSLTRTKEKEFAAVRYYSNMLDSKLKEGETKKETMANLREVLDALSAKVRHVQRNVRHLGIVGGSVKKFSISLYLDAIK